jgi:hypothetical protein
MPVDGDIRRAAQGRLGDRRPGMPFDPRLTGVLAKPFAHGSLPVQAAWALG